MIDLTKEKGYTIKDPKLQLFKQNIMFDKFKFPKFTSAVLSAKGNEYEFIIYIGLSNGSIVAMTVSKRKSLFHKYEEFTLLRCRDGFNHRGPVFTMIAEIIDGESIIFSGGVDGSIKVWTGELELKEKDSVHLIKTILAHKSTVMAMAFSRSRSLLASSSSDSTMKVYRMKETFDKIKNPFFECISTFRDFGVSLSKEKDLPFWISTLSMNESDVIELYAGDTKGRVLFYHYVDEAYLKFAEEERRTNGLMKKFPKKFVLNNFNLVKSTNMHNKCGTIKIMHSTVDSVIYSAGFDNHLVVYNVKTDKKLFDDANPNNKSHFTALSINYFTHEAIVGTDNGDVTIIKEDRRIKQMNSRIIYLNKLEIFSEQEHLLIISEDAVEICKIQRKERVSNVQHHDAEIIKLFVTEPVKKDQKIIEDAKIISASYDNTIKIWDCLTMDCINNIPGPELAKKNVEISTIGYLQDSLLIAVGTDIGQIFFWDLNRSVYLKKKYEKYIRHSSMVTCFKVYLTREKNSLNYKESLISCANDGLILVWEIEKTEIKMSTKKAEMFTEKDDLVKMNLQNQFSSTSDSLPSIFTKLLHPVYKSEVISKNYKCTPQVKIVINTSVLEKMEMKISVVEHSQEVDQFAIFSGGEDCVVKVWDMKNNVKKQVLEGHRSSVVCMTFDKHFLITGGKDGVIFIWNTYELESGNTKVCMLGEFTLYNQVRILDILMLHSLGILISTTNDKKIHFWRYEKGELLLSMTKNDECLCLAVVESYGKLLCGTRGKTIIRLGLPEILNGIHYPHDYEKYPFIKNESKYKENIYEKEITNFKIMNSLTKGIFEY